LARAHTRKEEQLRDGQVVVVDAIAVSTRTTTNTKQGLLAKVLEDRIPLHRAVRSRTFEREPRPRKIPKGIFVDESIVDRVADHRAERGPKDVPDRLVGAPAALARYWIDIGKRWAKLLDRSLHDADERERSDARDHVVAEVLLVVAIGRGGDAPEFPR